PGRPGGILTAMSQLWGRGRGVTGADGAFRIGGLASGRYRLNVADRGGRRLRVNQGGARRASAAGEDDGGGEDGIEVTIGEMRPVTGLRLVVEAQTGVIRGLVVGPDGQPVPDAWVTARARDFDLWRGRGGDGDDRDRAERRGGEGGGGKKTRTVSVTVGSGGSRVESSSDEDEDEKEEERRRRRLRRMAPAESPVLTGPDGRFEIRKLRD